MNSQKQQCKKCKKETIYQNYCMPCAYDLKEESQKEGIIVKNNEQIILLAIEAIKEESYKEELIEQIAKETYAPISTLRPKIERIAKTKDVHALINDLGFQKDVVYTKKPEKCTICETVQDFEKEPIIGCDYCEGQLEETLREDQKILLKKDKDKFKRLAYLQTDCYKENGELSKQAKDLSKVWFSKEMSKEEIDAAIATFEKGIKHPLRTMNLNIEKIKNEKEEKNNKERCSLCKEEGEQVSLIGNQLKTCKKCEEKIKSKTKGKMLDEGSQEYKNIVVRYYLKEVFEKKAMNEVLFIHLKKNKSEYNIDFKTLKELEEKNKEFIDSLENIKETIVFKVSGRKKKKADIIGLHALKKHIEEVLAFEEWQEKRSEKGLKTIKQNFSTFFVGKKGVGKKTGMNHYKNMMIEKGLAEQTEEIIFDRTLLEESNPEKIIENKLLQAKNAFVVFEDSEEFIATTKGKKVLDVLSEKMAKENVHVLLNVTQKNKADLVNKYMNYKVTKKVCFEEYNEKEFVELFEKIAEENDYEISNYARTVLKEHVKDKKKTKTYADYLLEKMVQNMAKRENNKKNPNVKLLTKEDIKKAIS